MDARLLAWMRRVARPIRRVVQPQDLPGRDGGAEAGRFLIELDYDVHPRPRWGYGRPPHPQLERLVAAGNERYRAQLQSFLPLVDDLVAIPLDGGGSEPAWNNGWYQGLDAVSLYGMLATLDPRRYVEVGSGNSTKFARRAVRDHGLRTSIASIDPHPRAEIDGLCDQVERVPLEEADLSVFEELESGDVLLVDGSHRCFMNSDATVAFTEVLPMLRAGVLVHFHDVFLPWDYPPQLADRHYSEHYLLAVWLLAGALYEIVLPNFYVSTEPDLHRLLEPLWRNFVWSATPTNGTGFWIRRAEVPAPLGDPG